MCVCVSESVFVGDCVCVTESVFVGDCVRVSVCGGDDNFILDYIHVRLFKSQVWIDDN